jgi:predicted HTH domain antitoxin
MRIEISDEIAQKVGVTEQEALELLAIAIYKAKGIHGSLAGKILGLSELEFHGLLAKRGDTVNYDVDDLIADIKNNDPAT